MRIAVTGASGNVGSAVVRHLVASGHDVVGVARRPHPAGITWVQTDLATDCRPELAKAFHGVDAVVHLAWGFQPTRRPEHLEAVGVGGTRQVLEVAGDLGVAHVVHQSSVGAYSPATHAAPVDEGWPTEGIASSAYSRHKVAAERLVDAFADRGDAVVTRMRPGIVGQRAAGSAQLRYFLPTLVPAAAITRVPVLPIADGLRLQLVHADDVARAIRLAVDGRVGGSFNLASERPVDPADIAAVLGARRLAVPLSVLRGAVAASWHARAQPVDAGWVDLAYGIPVMGTARAREELGWVAQHDGRGVLAEMVGALASAAHGPGAVLRPRTVRDGLRRAWREGAVARRPVP